ncbi:MAG: hypothetical protein BroJett013_30520 [Alphaproteobacteria bacterium]|nr:MAG: hypothetical protein BroJett013_30520 [Alphaproteobacteria bacterium]
MADIYGAKGRKLKADGLGQMADTRFYRGATSHILDSAKFANGALIGDKCYLGEIPSRAVILPQSTVYFGAFGTNCTLNIGDSKDDDALATLVSVASGGNTPLLEHPSAEHIVKPLWQLLGYDADPDRMIDLYASVAGANVSTATAFLTWSVLFGRG